MKKTKGLGSLSKFLFLHMPKQKCHKTPWGGVTPIKIGWGCAALFPKPLYPIFDQNQRFSSPYL